MFKERNPTPNLEDEALILRCAILGGWNMPKEFSLTSSCGTLFIGLICWDLSVLDEPNSSYAIASIAPNLTGSRNLPHLFWYKPSKRQCPVGLTYQNTLPQTVLKYRHFIHTNHNKTQTFNLWKPYWNTFYTNCTQTQELYPHKPYYNMDILFMETALTDI